MSTAGFACIFKHRLCVRGYLAIFGPLPGLVRSLSLSHTHTPCEIVFALARIRPAPLGKAHPESPKTQPRRPDIEVVWRLSVFVWMLCPKSSRSILPECWAEQLIACAHFNHLESDGAPLRVDFAGHGRSKSHLDIPVEPNSK